jgi:MarR family transcriptional regulator, 2-MHQ and catechol-resistance regulon repressor
MPTHYQGSSDEVDALDCYIKLMRATESVNRILLKALDGHDLTPGQFGVLELLHHIGPMTQSEIGQKMLRSDSNTCTVIDNLEKHGFISRVRESDDRRRVRVSLTKTGTEKIARVFPKFAAKLAEVFNTLSKTEKKKTADLMRKLGYAAQSMTSENESNQKT